MSKQGISNSRTREGKSRIFKTAIEEYTAVAQKGVGATGTVFEVKTGDDETRALKVVDRSKTPREKLRRFRNEISFCLRQVSPRIVRVLDYGRSDEGFLFYVMPFYPKTMRDLMKGPLPKGELFELFGQVLDGVDAAHRLGVFHRDIKPENILYDPSTNGLVLADFGICEFTEDELAATNVETGPRERIGNFAYAAPEQRLPGQKADQTADIYALGLILNEIFTGQIPHGTHYRQITETAPEFAYLDNLVEQMLCQQPIERPQSIRQLKDELIARGNDFVRQLKWNALKKEVVPEGELNDPLISDPIRAVEKLDYRDNTLTLRLNQAINWKWERCFRESATAFSANMSSAMISFNGDRVMIRVVLHFLDQGCEFFKRYCEAANEGYAARVRAEHQQEIQDQRAKLRARVAQEEARARALAKVKL